MYFMQQNQLVLFQPKYADAERVCVVKGYKDGLFTVVALGPDFVDLGITVVYIAYRSCFFPRLSTSALLLLWPDRVNAHETMNILLTLSAHFTHTASFTLHTNICTLCT